MNSFLRRQFFARKFASIATASSINRDVLPLDVHVYNREPDVARSRLFICHGLFGSGRNLGTLASTLARELNVESHSITLRNHGASAHSPIMTYDAMANDVLAYVQSLPAVANSTSFWLGHSLGGKLSMYVSLLYPQYVDKAVFVDIAPVAYEEKFSHLRIAKAMAECDLNNLTVKSAV